MEPIKSQPIAPPQVLSYKSILSYLLDYFQYRKNSDSHFSYDYWSVEMGFKSRAFMKMICSGQRNITEKFIQIYSKKMNFSEKEKLHFTLLAQLRYSKSDKLKDLYSDYMLKTLDLDQDRKDLDDQFFLSSLYNPVVQMLVGFKDFEATEENILKILPLEINHLRLILKSLQDLDLVYATNGVWKSKIHSFRIKNVNDSSAMKAFHLHTLMEAMGRLDKKDDIRKNRSVYFSIPENKTSELSLEIEEFLKKIRNKYGSENLTDQKIVKLNLQMYGLTEIFKKNPT